MKVILSLFILFGASVFAGEMNFTKETRGLVRHLPVYKYPRWVAKVELANGKEAYFCSPKSLFEFYWRPAKWYDLGVRSEADFKKLLVTDYASAKPVDARGAFFVYGSNVTSPAGDDLVAFKLYSDAQRFAKEHNGKRVLSFSQVNYALINLLNGRI